MNRGFFIILGSQFLSALADNALFIAAMALLKAQHAPEWHQSMMLFCFYISYVVLAPFAGSFADSMHKGRAMLICNAIKLAGCVSMLVGLPPLLAYAIVGFGAAAYSPAKYGIVTEYLPHEKLVEANGWLEGATVGAIIFGTVLGGQISGHAMAHYLTLTPLSMLSAPVFALIILCFVYLAAAWVNLYIPKLNVELKPIHYSPGFLIREFWDCVMKLWRDPQGQLSLGVTTLFWGTGAAMRVIVIHWAVLWLNFGLEEATRLVAIVAFGTAFGAYLAGRLVPLKRAFDVLPAGALMGATMLSMLFVHNVYVAGVLMFVVGSLAGFFVVPQNAMLQHRGALLMGAGHSIAVQNFNENLGILAMLGVHAWVLKHFSTPLTDTMDGAALAYFQHAGGIPPMTLIVVSFAGLLMVSMLYIIYRYHQGRKAGVMHD